jgi:tetratricopeptide (TPR) repeat protein
LDVTGIASVGDRAVNIQIRADRVISMPPEAFVPVTEIPVPAGLTNLPTNPLLFVGRAAELTQLDEALAQPGRVVVHAVHGLGGVGKSSLAAHWAAARAANQTLTWWITADTPASIDDGLVSLATTLQPALTGILPAEVLRERAVRWLAAHEGWLVVLDNVTRTTDVKALLAQARTGRYLITSRRSGGWHNVAVPIRLGVLAPAEALDLLTQILCSARLQDLDGAAELCCELGFLPLAIEQGGAYIAQAGINPRAYLDLLEHYPAAMYHTTAEGVDASRTIARIWSVTLDGLADNPLAGQLLRILAWYASEDIPRTLFDGLASPPELGSALSRLAAYSMITATPETVAVHRLVQAIARTPEPGDLHCEPGAIDAARDRAAQQLVAALPGTEDAEQWPRWRALLPHIAALASRSGPETDVPVTNVLFGLAGAFAYEQGQVALAVRYFQRAVAYSERVSGTNDHRALSNRSNLAMAYEAAGDLGQAIPLLERVLAESTRILGSDHPHTFTARSNLGVAYEGARDTDRAVPLLEQTLADRQRVLGSDHPDTLTARSNLGLAYRGAGDTDRAVPLLEQTLADRQRVLGSDHPDTLVVRNNLALAYESAGDRGSAIPLLEQALIDAERILGTDHPHTLTARGNLGLAHEGAGDTDRAVPLLEQTLADRQRVLGSDHPDTLVVRNNLALAYESAGDRGSAIPLLEQALIDAERILGINHPNTVTTRSNLALSYQALGDQGRAIPLLEQVLADRQRVLGIDHPETQVLRDNIVLAYHAAGDLGRAVPLLEPVLAERTRVLGADHPDTLVIRGNLAVAYQAEGNLRRAVPMLEQALDDSMRVLGADHLDTLTARNNLATAYHAAGDLSRAVSMLEHLIDECTRVLGTDHPATRAARTNLARARG